MSLILASRATVYDRYAISRRFTAQETAINVVQGNIALLVSASEIEELKNGNKTMYSRLASVEMNLSSITLAVSSSEYKDINGVLSAITQARTSITLNSQQIELKVSKDSLISTINQSAELVAINASKIDLNGVVTANQNFKILTDGSMEARNGKFRGHINGGSVYLDEKQFGGDSTAQMAIKGDGLYDYCILSDFELQFTDGAFFENDCNMIKITIDRDKSVKNQIRMNTNSGGHPSITFYENSILKTSLGGSGIISPSISADTLYGEQLIFSNATTSGNITIGNYAYITNLNVSGYKNRIVKTKNFGIVAQSAYETAEPMFGDLGHGIINGYGECIIFIDPKFAETVSTEYGYYVFVTKCSVGDVWIKEKKLDTFTIAGTPGLEFDWEIKAHQKGYERDRLRSVDLQ